MNVEFFVLIICLVLMNFIAMYYMFNWLSCQRKLDKKEALIKILQMELRYARGDEKENVQEPDQDINL